MMMDFGLEEYLELDFLDSPLHAACHRGEADVLRDLLGGGADISAKGTPSRSIWNTT